LSNDFNPTYELSDLFNRRLTIVTWEI